MRAKEERFLRKLTRLLEDRINSGNATVAEISRKMGMSRSTFYRRIRESTGCSPVEYLRVFQLKKAAALLKANFGNVSEVAYEAGFNNLSYFAKCFKEEYGISPGRYAEIQNPEMGLPAKVTSFVGRKQEMEIVKQLIREHRLVNLTGSAGTGKTRLAMEIVRQLEADFENGACAVHLASLDDPSLVPSAILQNLGIIENPSQPAIDTLVNQLQKLEILLLLDNFEHVTEAALVVNKLLQRCSELKVVITSREVLHLSGECEFTVPPLSVPVLKNTISKSDIPALKEYPSVKLLIERTRALKVGFDITAGNAADILRICHYLDGLPLALELAASQLKILSPHSLAERLSESLSVLSSEDTDRPIRHHTLLGAITWSYNQLTEPEKKFFRRLSLFSGSISLEAAETVWTEDSSDLNVLDGLRSLRDKNFLQTVEADRELRFRLLETLKAYGRSALRESREEQYVVRKIAGFFLELAREAEPELKGPRQKFWVDRLGNELDNFRGILSYLEQHREVELGLQLSITLSRFWNMQNLMNEGSAWLRKMVDLSNTLRYNEESHQTSVLKGKALSALGILAGQLSENFSHAADILRQSLTVFRKINDREALADNLNHYGWIKAHMGDYEEAKAICLEAKVLNTRLDKQRGISVACNNLGWIANTLGNLTEASELFSESLLWRQKIGDRRGIAYVSTNLAWVERALGHFDQGFNRLEHSYSTVYELNDKQLISWVQTIRGYTHYDLAQYSIARDFLEKAIDGWTQVGNRYGLSLSHGLLGLSLLSLTDFESALHHFEQARAYWNKMTSKWGHSFSDYCLGQYEIHSGYTDKARALHKKALRQRINQHEKLAVCESLEACAGLEADLRNHSRAIALLASASRLRKIIQAPHPTRFEKEYEAITSCCKQQMNHNAFEAAWREGKTRSMEELPEIDIFR